MGLLKQGQSPVSPAVKAPIPAGKGERLPQPASGPVALNYKDIEKEAVTLLSQVRRRAGQLLAAAEQEARVISAEIRAAAKAEGYAAGHAEGLAKGTELGRTEARQKLTADISAACTELRNVAAHFDAEQSRIRAGLLQDTVRLAVAIAERVCHSRIALDENALAANVRAALALVTDGSDVILSVSPSTMDVLGRELPQICRDVSGLGHVKLVADETLAKGDCTLQTKGGWVDGRIGEQLKRVEEALLGRAASQDVAATPSSSPVAA